MQVDQKTRAAILSAEEYGTLRVHMEPLRRFLEVMRNASSNGELPDQLSRIWQGFVFFEQTLAYPGALRLDRMRLTEDKKVGTATVPADEFLKFAAHMKGLDELLRRVATADRAKGLPPSVAKGWNELKKFLESREPPGSINPDVDDGDWCCVVATDAAGVIDCVDYHAWEVFACSACVAHALTLWANSQLSEGTCAGVASCSGGPGGEGETEAGSLSGWCVRRAIRAPGSSPDAGAGSSGERRL